MLITKQQAQQIIAHTKGKIFSCSFVKKDGSVRQMTARLGVKKGVNGKGLRFDALSKGLIPVFDVVADGYRMVNINTIKSLTSRGVRYNIEQH